MTPGSMRRRPAAAALALAALSFAPARAAETEVVPEPNRPPALSAEQPVNPAASRPGAPVIVSISARLGPTLLNATPEMIIPEFHFIAPNGDAVLLHRELVETSGNDLHFKPSAVIDIPAEAQKKGAVLSGGWSCGRGRYYATMAAYILDAEGGRSNRVKYTIRCNGG